MESRIRKLTGAYGIVAVLLALILVAVCYNFEGFFPKQESIIDEQTYFAAGVGLKSFSSYEELRDFLIENSRLQGVFPFLGPWDLELIPEIPAYVYGEKLEYSTTNIQVAGVDEADIVKTDGNYIYLISGREVFILSAYPPEDAQILSKITFTNDSYPIGIFINKDRLAILGCKYTIPNIPGYYRYPYIIDGKTFINIYDITNRSNPLFLNDFMISGSYFSSRMIGDYVYFVVSQPAYIVYDTVVLPKIYTDEGISEISVSKIYYSNITDECFAYTTLVAINIQNLDEEPNYVTILLGATSNMYVSLHNVYVTFLSMDGDTLIYRIRVENSTLLCEAEGKVPGRILNQFSMDEYNGYFRTATTKRVNGNLQNNVYVLDMNLSIVGKLENITEAFNEQIDSARFIGNRCYLTTSVVRRDPFFVIDLEDPAQPKVLGYLKIPGFTRYLHPYDETHIIGIGINEDNNVKISLFDVSNVSSPIELGNYTVEAAWSSTPVLWDHKAFLFDKARDLLVLPIQIRYNSYGWQGAYVFNITLNGIALKGSITHLAEDGFYAIKRALYIENVLYTISDGKVKLNSLEDLTLIKEIVLD